MVEKKTVLYIPSVNPLNRYPAIFLLIAHKDKVKSFCSFLYIRFLKRHNIVNIPIRGI